MGSEITVVSLLSFGGEPGLLLSETLVLSGPGWVSRRLLSYEDHTYSTRRYRRIERASEGIEIRVIRRKHNNMEKQSRQSRAKGKAPARGTRTPAGAELASGSRSGRGRGQELERAAPEVPGEVPLIYRDMLAEVGAGAGAQLGSGRSGSASRAGDDRPVKRRRVGERRGGGIDAERGRRDPGAGAGAGMGVHDTRPVQTVFDADASDDEEEMEWEDVEVSIATPASASASASGPGYDGAAEQQEVGAEESEESLQITFEKPEEKVKQRAAAAVRRKPVTAQEKRWRLDIHKMHVLCLLGHVQLRNLWCNDDKVQVCISTCSYMGFYCWGHKTNESPFL